MAARLVESRAGPRRVYASLSEHREVLAKSDSKICKAAADLSEAASRVGSERAIGYG